MSAPTAPGPQLDPQLDPQVNPQVGPQEPSPLVAALSRLVANGTLTPRQADAVFAEAGPLLCAAPVVTSPAPMAPVATGSAEAVRPDSRAAGRRAPGSRMSWTALLSEVGGYVGGAFVVAAVAVFTGPNWQDLSQAGRVAILAVPALLLATAALLVARGTPGGWTATERRGTTARRRLVSALLLVAAGLGGGVAAVLNPAGSLDDTLAYFATATVLAALGYAFCRGLVLHAATAFGAAVTTTSLVSQLVRPGLDGGWQEEQLWVGIGLLTLALAWAALTLTGLLAERALGLLAAGIMAFVSGEVLAMSGQGRQWVGFLVLAVLAAACLVGYLRLHHVAVLAVGVVALATVVPQAVIHYTDGALGAAGSLLVVGLSIVGASAAGLRLRKEVAEDLQEGAPEAAPEGVRDGVQEGVPSGDA